MKDLIYRVFHGRAFRWIKHFVGGCLFGGVVIYIVWMAVKYNVNDFITVLSIVLAAVVALALITSD